MDSVQPIEGRAAGFQIRAVARLIDLALGFFVGIVSLVLAMMTLAVRGQPGTPQDWVEAMRTFSSSFTATIMSFIGIMLYHSLSEAIGGATIGKLFCGLRVVSEDLTPATFQGTVLRSAAMIVDGLFFGYVAYRKMSDSPRCQRFGDHWGGTMVVRKQTLPLPTRGPGRLSVGILLGLWAWVMLQAWLFVTSAGAVAS